MAAALGSISAARSSSISAAGCGWKARRAGARGFLSLCRSELRGGLLLTKKILIVDDEPNIVAAVEFLLQRSGHETRIARDGDEALKLVEAENPDLVLLD